MSKSKGNLLFAVLGYATCSSLMLVVNKVCVHVLPAPSFVLLMQVASAALAVKTAGLLGLVEVDELELPKLKVGVRLPRASPARALSRAPPSATAELLSGVGRIPLLHLHQHQDAPVL